MASSWQDFLAFRRMIAPTVIEVLFWIGLLAVLIAGIVLITQQTVFGGIATIIVGPFIWRIICEFLMIGFRIHACLEEISQNTAQTPQK